MKRPFPRARRVLGGLVAVIVVLSGCGLLGRAAVRVVMKIAEEVVVTAGAEFVHQLISGGDGDRPTVTINYRDASQRQVAVTYSVDDAKAISVSSVEGSVEITGSGNQTTVRVRPPSTATIEILGTDHPVPDSARAATQEQVVPEPAVTAQDPDPDTAKAAKILSGTWQGKYRCGQGLTGLRLVLYPTSDGTLLGTFNFYAVDSNPGVPSGSYAMRGTYSESWFDLKGDYWIEQPTGYGMVDVAGDVPAGPSGHLTGRLPGSCKNYDLAKTSKKTSKPPI